MLSKLVKGAAKQVNNTVLQDYYCFGPKRTVCNLYRGVDMVLVLHVNRVTSIRFCGKMEDACTCEFEAAAQESIHRSNMPSNNSLLLFAAKLGKGEYEFKIDDHYPVKMRSKSCGCGRRTRR